MAGLTESRWTRFGHDRVYVETDDGDKVGFVDLKERLVHTEVEGFDGALHDCLTRWTAVLDAGEESERPDPRCETSVPVSAIPIPKTTDLATNVAGQSAQRERDRINSEAPIRNLVARLLGEKTDERNWRVGAAGERSVGRELGKLGPQWRCLHSVEVGSRGSDIDHVVVGPPGVITLNTKCHPKGKAWVGERMVMINGHKTPYLRNSRHEVGRAQRLISEATGWIVPAQAAIVMVGLDKLTVKQMPDDVAVATCRQLRSWLENLSCQLTPGQIESVFAIARNSNTWTPDEWQRAS